MGGSQSTITSLIGCIPLSSVGGSLSGSYANANACYAYCRNNGYTYGLAQPLNSGTLVSCGCTNDVAQPSILEPAQVTYLLGSQAGCGDAAYGLQTSFLNTDPVCYTVPGSVISGMAVYPDPSQCFTDCRFKRAMWLIPVYNANTGENDWRCSCATAPPPNAPQAVCGPNKLLYMTHTQLQASQGVARRKRQEAALKQWAKSSLCAPNQTACKVGESDYECLDLDNELESCGGCMNGVYDELPGMNSTAGVDCETLPGVAVGGSTCQRGKCVAYSCRPGYSLKDGKCVRRRPTASAPVVVRYAAHEALS